MVSIFFRTWCDHNGRQFTFAFGRKAVKRTLDLEEQRLRSPVVVLPSSQSLRAPVQPPREPVTDSKPAKLMTNAALPSAGAKDTG